MFVLGSGATTVPHVVMCPSILLTGSAWRALEGKTELKWS